MKKLIIASLLLTSCKTVEVWDVEKHTLQWEEEILIPADHWHSSGPTCYYYEADTICWVHYDTLYVKTLREKRTLPIWSRYAPAQ